jgi:hypothetical protein
MSIVDLHQYFGAETYVKILFDILTVDQATMTRTSPMTRQRSEIRRIGVICSIAFLID